MNEILFRIQQWSEKTPDKIAVVAEGKNITYGELINSSRKIADFLCANELHRTGFIGVFLSQCHELPSCLLAIWMVGAAYLPLDPIYPQNRISDMINSVDLSCILTNSAHKSMPTKLKCDLVNVDEVIRSSGFYDEMKPLRIQSEDLAYLIFTSGSTGKPKGVKISPKSLSNLLTTFARELQVGPNDSLLSLTPISFDIFGLELFLPLISGGTCYFSDRSIAFDAASLLQNLEEHKITIFQATPSTYHLLVEETWPRLQLRHMLCGGESWEEKLADSLLKMKPPECGLWNVYGPTETTIWSSLCKVTRADCIYLAPSVDFTCFYVLDDQFSFVEEGELYIGGAGVAMGYYKDDVLTKARFIDAPFNPSLKIYKTGDVVRSMGNGHFQFVGRKDQQVKIRGFRVELEEIEHILLRHSSISRAVVVYDYLKYSDEKTLVACVQCSNETDLDYRQVFLETLPSYMIPQHFLKFGSLPLTPNLKIDRQKITEKLRDIFRSSHKISTAICHEDRWE